MQLRLCLLFSSFPFLNTHNFCYRSILVITTREARKSWINWNLTQKNKEKKNPFLMHRNVEQNTNEHEKVFDVVELFFLSLAFSSYSSFSLKTFFFSFKTFFPLLPEYILGSNRVQSRSFEDSKFVYFIKHRIKIIMMWVEIFCVGGWMFMFFCSGKNVTCDKIGWCRAGVVFI